MDEIEVEPDAEIVCYCHHGVRSLTAASILRQAGFGRAVSLAGGIDLWSRRIDPSVPRY
jgi:rhodanese-related sulfurtransferase